MNRLSSLATAMVIAMAVGALGFAAGFVVEGGRATSQSGGGFLLVEKSGQVVAGIEGRGRVNWGLAFWHDKGGYSGQGWAKADKPLAVGDDGVLRVAGVFQSREGAIPIRYSQEVRAEASGWRIRYEVAKTGDITINHRGVRLVTGMDYHHMRGRRVFLHPARFARMPATMRSLADAVHYEVAPGRALRVRFAGLCPAETKATGLKACLLHTTVAGDMAKGTSVAFELRVDFADMPPTLPGQVVLGRKPLALRGATLSARRIGRFERLEVAVALDATYDNPYDPAEVALDAIVTTPSGKRLTVPGFYKVDHERRVLPQGELMMPTGRQGWCVRFTPSEVGRHTLRLTARDRSGKVERDAGAFDVTPTTRPGFVRISKADPHYFAFDNGKAYFAIGHNLPIYHHTGQLGLEAIRKMAARDENYNRWWMCSYGFGIEWDHRLVSYRQDEAARIDMALDLADQLGFYYMMCMDTHQDFRDRRSWEGWFLNPYNVACGGPCESTREWLTDTAARAYYRKRLRYTVARWGYSPNVLCWEFGNEFEGWPDADNAEKLEWHLAMARHLKAIDPFHHLVTTSFWGKTGPPEFWQAPEMDIVQTHHYSNNEGSMAEAVADYSRAQAKDYAKPHLFAEFGIASRQGTAESDPKGWYLHNALWAGTMSFCAGAPMPWWHESYIDPFDHYFHFTAIGRFVKGLPMATARWRTLEFDSPKFLKTPAPKRTDVVLRPRAWWGKPKANVFAVRPDGSVNDIDALSALLQGRGHADIKNPPAFEVTYPAPGQFILRVGRVSRSGRLSVWVDERLVLERELPCGEGLGRRSRWVERWNLWETTYDEDITVPVPAGRHTIRIDNDGGDWVNIVHYRLPAYQTVHKPKLIVLGMQNDQMAVLWLHNRDATWAAHYKPDPIAPVPPATLTLRGLADGPCTIEWWATWKGVRQRTERAEVKGGRLVLKLPELTTDIALKILPAN